ncbi:Fic family protein [uncultured Tessaracoccus sp.]|uniref:Fic family protein n=1 Tax=uncultured Tessaracoccus sp. TaxID=905023 RepID=UPI0025E79AE1|nr:Fic family protein [uncultured Tessaracoccus sp.]
MTRLTVNDLARVVYSSGKVFDGLGTGRLDTERFLRSGDTTGVTSRADLALLQDLRDVAQFVIDHGGRPIDAAHVREVNAQLTRSAALHPGQYRSEAQGIGVRTRYGVHRPPAVDDASMQRLLDQSRSTDPEAEAVNLFVALAKAQPFEDGNKRTALFVANSRLIGAGHDQLLAIPVDEDDPGVADAFNDALARAYVFDDDAAVQQMLHEHGLFARDGNGVR